MCVTWYHIFLLTAIYNPLEIKINFFIFTNWNNNRAVSVLSNNLFEKFRSWCLIFPIPFAVGFLFIQCSIRRSIQIIYIAACAFLSRINFLFVVRARRGETRRRQVQIYRTTFPECAYPSDPAALITFHGDLSSNSSCPPTWRTPRRRDRVTDVHPSRGDPDGYAGFDGNKGMLV